MRFNKRKHRKCDESPANIKKRASWCLLGCEKEGVDFLYFKEREKHSCRQLPNGRRGACRIHRSKKEASCWLHDLNSAQPKEGRRDPHRHPMYHRRGDPRRPGPGHYRMRFGRFCLVLNMISIGSRFDGERVKANSVRVCSWGKRQTHFASRRHTSRAQCAPLLPRGRRAARRP